MLCNYVFEHQFWLELYIFILFVGLKYAEKEKMYLTAV